MKEIINHTAHGGWFRLNPNMNKSRKNVGCVTRTREHVY
jgi:hypothetical protein